MRPRLRLLLLLLAAAIAAMAGPVVALALLVARAPSAGTGALAALGGVAVATVFAAAALVLSRAVAPPLERLLAAAERLAPGEGELPALGPPGEGGLALSRAALAFERLSGSLAGERARLAAKVDELAAANRRLEEARDGLSRAERLATVGRLASGVAHEVGNPLGAISGYAELGRARLRDGRGAAEVDDCLARIAAEARRIDAIVRDLLDFARPAPPALAPVDLPAAVDAAVRLARVQPRFREVEVALELDGAPRVVADERRLAQVFLNLPLNAGDAMRGSGRVRISARELAAPARVEVAVADSGPGIPPEHLARVFDPFFTTKEPGEGTGLGLAVCHGIVASFGGEIAAANRPEGGAVVRLVLRAA